MPISTNPCPNQEARWPAVLALFAIVGLRIALPRSLAASPAWVPLVIVAVLVVPTILARQMRRHQLNQWLGFVITGIVTLDMVWSLALLVASLPVHRLAPTILLRSSAVLWVSNILDLCIVVLAAGRRRPECARPPRGARRGFVSLSADDS